MTTPSAFFQRLRDGGIQTREFNPINPLKIRGNKWMLKQRDHRKILIVDGKVAFTGGINISNVYSSSSSGSLSRDEKGENSQQSWRDTDVQIEGPP